MLKTNRIMCFLLLLAFVVLVIGQNGVSAAGVNATDELISAVDGLQESTVESPINGAKREKSIEKDFKRNVKSSQELENLSIHMDDVEVDYGEVADLNVLTTPEVDEGILSWYIRGALVGASNLSTSPACCQINTLDYKPGNYSVEVTYTGSLIYSSNVTTASLKINPIDSRIENFAAEFDDDNNIMISLNVLAGNEMLPFGTLNVYHENTLIQTYEIEDEDVSFTLDKSYNQETLCIEYVGDDYYLTSQNSFLVNVPKYSTNIYMPQVSGYYADNVTQTLTFFSNHPVNDGYLDVYVDGFLVEEYNVSGASVDVDFNMGNYDVGVHTIYLEYFGSDVYEDVNCRTNLTVRKINTRLNAYNVTAHRNDSVKLRAYVYNYVEEGSEGLLEFFIDDESIRTTWLNGQDVSVDYIIPDTMEYGLHELRVVYYGSDKYESGEKIAYLNLTPYSNVLSVRNYSLDDDGRIAVDVNCYCYNHTVSDGYINCYVDNVFVGRVDVNGNITCITLPGEYEGDNEYTLRLEYAGSEYFENASLTTAITPEKCNTTTRLYTYANTDNILNLTGYVYASNYAQINEGVLEFLINDIPVGTSGVVNSRASILVNMDEYQNGIYDIKAVYNETRLYRTSQNITSINYTRYQKALYIQAPNSVSQKATQKINISINLTDYDGNAVPVSTYVTLTIFDVDYPVWTENGQVNFEYKIASNVTPGTYNITIRADATMDYRNASRNIRLNVYKDLPYITSQNIFTRKGETILVNATLNMKGEVLSENITGILKINNKTVYQGIFKNGQFQYKLVLSDKYTNNEYNITFKSKETHLYHTAEKTITLHLNQRNTYIVSQNIESKNGEKIIINATIYDSITKARVKGTNLVCIKINDVTLDNVMVKNGQLLYTYTNDYSTRDYNIRIIYGQNGIYNSSTWNGTLTIRGTPLKIAAENMQAKAYGTITIMAQILDQKHLASGIIKTAIKINNKTIREENITDGKIEFDYTLPDEMGAGTYNLTIIAGDSRRYTRNTTTVKLVVNKNYKEIQTEDITAHEGDNITVRARLADINNNTITKNTRINIKLAGHTITTYNITDGNIEYGYVLPSAYQKGKYDLLIQAGESSGYYHASKIASLKIE